ncbi:hypothetical protein SELMODRAFT_128036 [Selaginella moellendorffii]|uniref:Uncharacterized protein n=1 Tax=Selaginella moellendorffii TaxID=88036 RepID=D8SYS0_SELML|nr:hypothetical protein SELMODRAFT_128036 [Selaginella moellendorffii]
MAAQEGGEEAPPMAPDAPEQQDEQEDRGGELLYCGTTSWDTVGRKQADSGSLPAPTRLSPLKGVQIAFVASGSDSLVREEKLEIYVLFYRYKVVKAGSGRQHTVVITDDGNSFAFGFNKHGQLGSGHVKDEVEKLPLKCLVSEATHVSCGADFTVWLSSVEGASILTAGLPQYGQLGHGTDNEYNMKEGSVKLAYEAQSRPRPVAAFSEKMVTKVACGHNHTVASDSNGFVYTWGYGGYGRLGHKEQKDEWTPRLVEVFQRQNVLPPTAVVAAGAAFSACTAGGGQLYMWGRVKATGDNWMYPKPLTDLNGWTIRSMDSGNTISMVAAETSCISWGTAFSGELGYGPSGPKSSANPKKIDSLEGMHVISVACGLAHSMMIVSRSKDGAERLEEVSFLDCWEHRF